MRTLLLSKSDIENVLTMKTAIQAVEEAYTVYQQGAVEQPPIQSMIFSESGGEADVKSCYNHLSGQFSIKTVGLFPGNADGAGRFRSAEGKRLPNMMGNVILSDGRTGATLAVMDASLITGIRTGAAGAVSAKYMARPDAKTAAVFAAGAQARMQVYALAEVRELEEIRVYDRFADDAALKSYQRDVVQKTGIDVSICSSVEQAAAGADILICPTPSREYYVKKEYVCPGAHIIEVGVDDVGKAELDPELFADADKVVCDSISECAKRGETRNALNAGIITERDIYGEIGEIVTGQKCGRISEQEITIFDTTGLGIQDNVTARICYDRALQKGVGFWYEFI